MEDELYRLLEGFAQKHNACTLEDMRAYRAVFPDNAQAVWARQHFISRAFLVRHIRACIGTGGMVTLRDALGLPAYDEVSNDLAFTDVQFPMPQFWAGFVAKYAEDFPEWFGEQ